MCPYSLSEFGGVQGQVLGLARELRELGKDVRVIGPSDGPPPEPGITSIGSTTSHWPSNDSVAPVASSRAVAARTLEAVRTFDPDVVHLHEPLVPGPTHAIVLGTDLPSVGTFHSWSPTGPHPVARRLRRAVKAALRRLTVSTAVSEEAASMAAQYYGVEVTEVLFNGVDVPRFADAEPAPTERPTVFFVGRHEPRKGLAVLLEAWRGIDRDARLWVGGVGPETDALRGMAVPRVSWLGRIDDDELASRMQGATVFCAPAISHESFGIVLIEAMAASTPVVATDIPGYRNVARSDREGLLVPPDDPPALRAALQRALDEPALRAKLVTAGDVRAREFSLRRLAEEYLSLYDVAIARPPRR